MRFYDSLNFITKEDLYGNSCRRLLSNNNFQTMSFKFCGKSNLAISICSFHFWHSLSNKKNLRPQLQKAYYANSGRRLPFQARVDL